MNALLRLAVLIGALCLTACPLNNFDENSFDFVYDLDEGAQDWRAGFADYPAEDRAQYELNWEWTALPSPLAAMHGIFVTGNNHSDDLFMYIKHELIGLDPNTRYELTFNVEFATGADSGCAGIGGAPGESVVVKAGATAVEPMAETDSLGILRMNIDHGAQSSSGSDAIVIGNIAGTHTDCTDNVYELKTLDSEDSSFEIFAGENGELWAIFAIDSGFEGTTGIYFTHLEIHAEKVEEDEEEI